VEETDILQEMKSYYNPRNLAGMARYGIKVKKAYGVPAPLLRQIGKRNLKLRAAAIKTSREIQKLDSRAARWIAADALRELSREKAVARIRAKGAPR
jgi:3-methyladenine DNA glycosylase AlkD